MKERPILFSAPMVRAILEGRKTMTRRVVSDRHLRMIDTSRAMRATWTHPMPYGEPSDRLWVRETFAEHPDGSFSYRATDECGLQWTPSIFMPRTASRILLEVTEVRVERLNEISDHEAICEGIMEYEKPHGFGTGFPDADPCVGNTPINAFRLLWQSINGPDSWALNPWVWVVSFRRLQQ